MPEEKQPHVFLTNQSTLIFKRLTNLAAQQTPPKDINDLTIKEIADYMLEQFNPKRFVVRERHKFWRNIGRKPGETIPELVARIRADAQITDPQDEALRTRFICSIENEAVLKALFRAKDNELTFAKAVEIAQESEDAAAVAKETAYGRSKPVYQIEPSSVDKVVQKKKFGRGRPTPTSTQSSGRTQSNGCHRCGRTDHKSGECPFKDAICHHCQ